MTSREMQTLAAHLITEIRENMSERDFQRDYFESVADHFEQTDRISEKQLAALNRIYERVTQ